MCCQVDSTNIAFLLFAIGSSVLIPGLQSYGFRFPFKWGMRGAWVRYRDVNIISKTHTQEISHIQSESFIALLCISVEVEGRLLWSSSDESSSQPIVKKSVWYVVCLLPGPWLADGNI